MKRATSSLVGVLLLCTGTIAFGQTLGWTFSSTGSFGLGPGGVTVLDLDSASVVYSVRAPSGVCVGGAAMSPDRRMLRLYG